MHDSCPKYRIFLQKTWIAWLTTLKFFSHADEVPPYKRLENDFFVSGAIHCENAIWKIQIFAFNLCELKYLHGLFWKVCSTHPQNFWGLKGKGTKKAWLDMQFCVFVNSSQKYVKKVKLHLNFNPNIFSEIIELRENGGSGGIQAQIPNCTVFIGIAA